MPHILWFRQDISDCIAIPIIGSGHICFALTRSPAPLGEIIGRTLHFVHHQDFGYHVRPHPLRTQAKDTAHDFCCFLIHQPVVLDFRVLLEPVGDGVGDRLAGPSTHLVLRFLLPAAIPDVPLRRKPYIKNTVYMATGKMVLAGMYPRHLPGLFHVRLRYSPRNCNGF